jgi:hypothetical protein
LTIFQQVKNQGSLKKGMVKVENLSEVHLFHLVFQVLQLQIFYLFVAKQGGCHTPGDSGTAE